MKQEQVKKQGTNPKPQPKPEPDLSTPTGKKMPW